MLGGVLGCYIQGGITFKGALLFSIYGISVGCSLRVLVDGTPDVMSILVFKILRLRGTGLVL